MIHLLAQHTTHLLSLHQCTGLPAESTAPTSAPVLKVALLISCRFVAELPVKMAPLLAEVEAAKVCRHREYLGTCMLSRIHPARKVKC
jgi:hypothetical protein